MIRERATRKPWKMRRLDREASPVVVVVVVWDELKPTEIRPWIYNLQEEFFFFFWNSNLGKLNCWSEKRRDRREIEARGLPAQRYDMSIFWALDLIYGCYYSYCTPNNTLGIARDLNPFQYIPSNISRLIFFANYYHNKALGLGLRLLDSDWLIESTSTSGRSRL